MCVCTYQAEEKSRAAKDAATAAEELALAAEAEQKVHSAVLVFVFLFLFVFLNIYIFRKHIYFFVHTCLVFPSPLLLPPSQGNSIASIWPFTFFVFPFSLRWIGVVIVSVSWYSVLFHSWFVVWSSALC